MANRLMALSFSLLLSSSACSRADAFGSFSLAEHDKIVAEAAGCRVECRIVSPLQRTCTVRDPSCRAECLSLPECRLDSTGPMRVCAVVRDRQ